MKRVDSAAYDMIKAEKEGKFPGGQTLVFDAKKNGVGIPASNPNLKPEVSKKVAEVLDQLKAGKIAISAEKGDLIK